MLSSKNLNFVSKQDTRYAHRGGTRGTRFVPVLKANVIDTDGALRETRNESNRNSLGNTVTAADRQIDRLMYALYGLTAEEIALGGASP